MKNKELLKSIGLSLQTIFCPLIFFYVVLKHLFKLIFDFFKDSIEFLEEDDDDDYFYF